MNVLITGGGGYLGSELVQVFLARGHKVTVVDTFMHRVPSLLHVACWPNLQIIRCSALDIDTYRSDLVDAHIVIPLAAIVGSTACDKHPDLAHVTNCAQIEKLVYSLSRTQRIVYPCTNSGYGTGGEDVCTEESPLNPLTWYGKTKVEGEHYALLHSDSISLRFATLFGPSLRMRNDLLVNSCVKTVVDKGALTIYEGHYRRNFLHVADAANAIYCAALDTACGIFNVGNDSENMTKLELAQKIHSAFKFVLEEGEGKDSDQRDYIVSSEKFYRTFNWRPRLSLDVGIRQLIQVYENMDMDGPGFTN